MVKKVLCGVLAMILILSLAPQLTVCADTGLLQISSTPAGADVYIDGNFSEAVSPCTLELPTGTHKVELKVPGYETYTNENVQITTGETTVLSDMVQLPELTETDADHTLTVTTLADKVRWSSVSDMDAITVAQLKADTGTPISLREAIQAVKNEPSESGHYSIEFDPSLSGGAIHLFEYPFPVPSGMLQCLYIEKRGDMTINGDINRDGTPDITLDGLYGTPDTPTGSMLNVYASNVQLAGLNFDGSHSPGEFDTLTFRVSGQNTQAYNVENVSVAGCKFKKSAGVGIATCIAYGYGATGYGGAGTANYKNLIFAGNIFEECGIFSFAGAGDADYNVIDSYTVAANQFSGSGIGMLAADAHTWYVFGKENADGNGGIAGQIGYSCHNKVMNVTISGNTISQGGVIGFCTANMGNSDNLIDNVMIRNNVSRLSLHDSYASVSINNVDIGCDSFYHSNVAPFVHHDTANNKMSNITVKDNDFELGDLRSMEISNVGLGYETQSNMDGTGNTMEHIIVDNNKISARSGVIIASIKGYNDMRNDDITGNVMSDIRFTNNILSRTDTDGYQHRALIITGFYDEQTDFLPDYHDNTFTDIDVSGNTIENFNSGIIAAGSTGNGATGQTVENIAISNNTITCLPGGDFGIVLAGSAINGYGNGPFNGSTQCKASHISLTGNTITAPGGILLSGTFINSPVRTSLAGNNISDINVSDNTIIRSAGAEINRPLPGIIAADILETWPRIEADTVLDNNSCGQPDIHDNDTSGFICDVLDMSQLVSSYPIGSPKTAEEILNGYKASVDAVLGENSMEWNWYGDSYSSSGTGSFIAKSERKGQIGFDYLYQSVNTTNDYYVRFDIGSGTRTGGGELVQSVKSGEDAVAPEVTPPDGYSFDGWDKSFTNVSGPLTVNATYTSLENQYNVIVSVNNAAYGTITGGGSFTSGSNATVSATPKSGYRFVRWASGGTTVSVSASYTFIVSADASLTAEFTPLTPVVISCSKTDNTIYGGKGGSIAVFASGGDSGLYEYSLNGGTWQSGNVYNSLSAGTYTITVRDAAYMGNTASCTVIIGQPTFEGKVPANKISSKPNAGTALEIVPPAAPKGYTVISVTYSSTNPAVAAVDASGNVTFLAGGKTTIITTITSQMTDSKGRVKTKTTTVKKAINVQQPVSSMTLNLADTTIARTQKVKLTANFAPATASNKKVMWKSSNPKVAAVSSAGVVTGKAGGTAVITCTAKDGSNVSASCVVTVTPIYPTGIKLFKTTLAIKPGKTAALKATVSPKNTDFKTVAWSSSNPVVATVDAKGKINALSTGTAVITATTSNGKTISCTVSVQ